MTSNDNHEIGTIRPYVYLGLRATGKDLSDCFGRTTDLDTITMTFKKDKKGTYGIGEIVDINKKGEHTYNLKATNVYISGHDAKLKELGQRSWAEERKANYAKNNIKIRKESTAIENMTVKELLATKDRSAKKAIIAYLLSKL